MLRIYKTISAHLTPLSLSTLEAGSWINLVNPTQEELREISDKTNVHIDYLKAALDEEERSHMQLDNGLVLILTNVPIMRSKDSYDALPLGMIVTLDYIITVALESNLVLNEFRPETSENFCTFKKTRFIFQILHKSALLYLKYLKQINHRTDEIEKSLRQSMKNEQIFELLLLHKGLTYFTASLKSNGLVLERLLHLRSSNHPQQIIKIYEEDEELLEDVIIENKQAIEMVEMYSNILSNMTDTFTSIISNNLNIVMKVLTSCTILIAVPTMISSFMGMNVDVPYLDEIGGFRVMVMIAAAATAITAFVLWKNKMFS